MTPVAAKLLMCVCAGSTGALVVPAAHKAKAALSRQSVHHTAVRATAVTSAAAAVPCVVIASAPPVLAPIGDMPAESGSGDLAQLTGLGGNAGGDDAGGLGYGSFADAGWDGDGLTGGIGIGSGIGGGSGGVNAGVPVVAPISGAVPEPASWAMMIGGFGTLGTAMRWQRRAAA